MLTKSACVWRRGLNAFHMKGNQFRSSVNRVSHAKQTRFGPYANAFHSLFERAREMYYTLRLTGATIHSRNPNSVRPLGQLVAIVTGCLPWGARLGVG